MITKTKINKIDQRNNFENKSLYAAIAKVLDLNIGLTVSQLKREVKAQFLTWRLADFNFYDLELVSSHQEKGYTYYILEDQQFSGYETVGKQDIANAAIYPTVKERVLDLEEFEGGNTDKAIDFLNQNMPYEFSQLCAFAVRYKQLVSIFESKFKTTYSRVVKTTSIQKKIDNMMMELAPINKEDY